MAREGVKYNINANSIAPIAASQMTATVMPPEVLANLTPDHVAPVVLYLCHESTKDTGRLWESGAGWTGQTRWEQSKGVIFKVDDSFTPSAVRARFAEICDFKDATHPGSQQDGDMKVRVLWYL